MIYLRRLLSIADSHYFAAAIACRNYVAAVDMTFRNQPLSAIAGSNFAAVDDFSAAIINNKAVINYGNHMSVVTHGIQEKGREVRGESERNG